MAKQGNNFKRFEEKPKNDSKSLYKTDDKFRLNRFIARSGYCSRRQADVLIFDSKVKVNGKLEINPGTRVGTGDSVEVNGQVLQRVDHVYILFNKGKDTITSTKDDKGRKTVMDYIPDSFASSGLFPVGRLDRNTEGALLITNDGELAHRLMHPSFEVKKIYRVKTEEQVSDDDLERLKSGIELEDGPASADQVSFTSADGYSTAVGIHEGRNRQVRRMYEALGHDIISLERIHYAGLTTKGIRRGKWRILDNKEVKRLKKQVGLKDISDQKGKENRVGK